MQMQMDYQKPTSLGIINKGNIFQRKPNLQQVEHMLVEKRFGQTPSAIPKPDRHPQTHTHTHTHTHTNQRPMFNSQWSIANGHWQMGNGQLSMVNGQWWMVTSQWSKANCQWPLAKGHWPIANGEVLIAILNLGKTYCVCIKKRKLTMPQGFKCERAMVNGEWPKVNGNHVKW